MMLKTRQKCKPYYVAPVNRIMPSKCELGTANLPIGSIMRLAFWATYLLSTPGTGGSYAYTGPVRSQGRLLAQIRQLESTPRARPRYAVPDPSFLRSARFGAGQIRDVAPGDQRWAFGRSSHSGLWLLAGKMVSTAEVLGGRGAGRVTAPQQRTPAGLQVIQRGGDLHPANHAGRARVAHDRVAYAARATVWLVRPSAQYRTSGGSESKKSLPQISVPDIPTPATVRSRSDCQERYEALRCQALQSDRSFTEEHSTRQSEAEGSPCHEGPELAFIEQQGLAAWIAAGSSGASAKFSGLSGMAVPVESLLHVADEQLPKLQDVRSSSGELVLALADLVLGNSSGGTR